MRRYITSQMNYGNSPYYWLMCHQAMKPEGMFWTNCIAPITKCWRQISKTSSLTSHCSKRIFMISMFISLLQSWNNKGLFEFACDWKLFSFDLTFDLLLCYLFLFLNSFANPCTTDDLVHLIFFLQTSADYVILWGQHNEEFYSTNGVHIQNLAHPQCLNNSRLTSVSKDETQSNGVLPRSSVQAITFL